MGGKFPRLRLGPQDSTYTVAVIKTQAKMFKIFIVQQVKIQQINVTRHLSFSPLASSKKKLKCPLSDARSQTSYSQTGSNILVCDLQSRVSVEFLSTLRKFI